MKKIYILSAILLTVCTSHAQRFFYIEKSQLTSKLLTDQLQHAFQYVTTTPVASDYIIHAEVGFQPGTHRLTLQITLQDSLSFQTVYEASEIYDIRKSDEDQRLLLSMAIRTFIEKNIQPIVGCAKGDHLQTEMKNLDSRKDRT